ncbi:hypothetical protein FS559_04080 [Treponema phagedenis]|nr:hypothetical protein FS559_04080 [Treponema phagedenis]
MLLQNSSGKKATAAIPHAGEALQTILLRLQLLPWTAKPELPRMAVVPNSRDVLKQDYLQSFKTCRFGFDMDVKNSEPPRMAVVLNRIEFENYHSYINRSFQTHRFHFDTDVKMKPLCRTLFYKTFYVLGKMY